MLKLVNALLLVIFVVFAVVAAGVAFGAIVGLFAWGFKLAFDLFPCSVSLICR